MWMKRSCMILSAHLVALLLILCRYPCPVDLPKLHPQPVFMFANQAGLDMLETTLVALQDIALEKIFDESGRN
ncbi:hypothetical protein Bca52824_081835 [Brassica carinata]|uniref:MEKHLA domain-containing protein n=1 Tax=Brassica carinata TaxID=52824 RepID=A0A8X7TRZ6_BRACI|nr:hypothetical protein Bca52824_081835 [Brassica carinata]